MGWKGNSGNDSFSLERSLKGLRADEISMRFGKGLIKAREFMRVALNSWSYDVARSRRRLDDRESTAQWLLPFCLRRNFLLFRFFHTWNSCYVFNFNIYRISCLNFHLKTSLCYKCLQALTKHQIILTFWRPNKALIVEFSTFQFSPSCSKSFMRISHFVATRNIICNSSTLPSSWKEFNCLFTLEKQTNWCVFLHWRIRDCLGSVHTLHLGSFEKTCEVKIWIANKARY